MRKPTDLYASFAWWRGMMGGDEPAAFIDTPMPGFYQRRLVRNGVWVPVAIWLEQDIDEETGELMDDERLVCAVNGLREDPMRQWSYCAGHPITEQEYNYLIARNGWAKEHAPATPLANPTRPVTLGSMDPVF